jgi:GAF domain-containing protein
VTTVSQSGDRSTVGKGQPSRDDTGGGSKNSLAEQLGELARSLNEAKDVQSTLDEIVRHAVATVPGAEHASISAIRRRREVFTRASTNDISLAVDQAQFDTGQGPCLESLYDHVTVRLSDVTTEQRWPKFIERVRAHEVGSMLAVQLYIEGGDLGALSMFSAQADAFDDDSEHIALLFASHAAVAMGHVQQVAQLRQAVGSRDLIGQAKGMLMERFGINAEQAFGLLVRASQLGNRKLYDIVVEVTGGSDIADMAQESAAQRT